MVRNYTQCDLDDAGLTRIASFCSEFADVVGHLIAAGAQIDIVDNDGETAEGWALTMLDETSPVRGYFNNRSTS